jgi:sugar lactone lactonase YvrE
MKRFSVCVLVLLFVLTGNVLFAQPSAEAVGTIRTIAGGGHPAFTANAVAREAVIEGASSVALDGKGNLYVTAFLANRVFKIDFGGKITLFAGNGERATSGDGGAATQAAINGPNSVAVDGEVVYIAEQLGDRIRRVDEKGTITTFAGNGKREPFEDGVSAREAGLSQPAGLALHNGELYFTEFAGNYVRKVTREGKVYTLAGTGQRASTGDGGPAKKASVKGPVGIVVDKDGVIYITEVFAAVIRKFKENGVITTVVGQAPSSRTVVDGAKARFVHPRWPHGLALDAKGDLYFSDFAGNHVYVVNPAGIIKTLAGTGSGGFSAEGKATSVSVESPLGIAVDNSGNLFVALYGEGAVLRIDREARLSHVAGHSAPAVRSEMRATEAFFKGVSGVAADAHGNVFLADAFGNTIHKINPAGRMQLVAGNGAATFTAQKAPAAQSTLHFPVGIAPLGGGFFVVEAEGHSIKWIDASGNMTNIFGTGKPGFSGDLAAAASAGGAHPHGIVAFGEDVINPVPFLADASSPANASPQVQGVSMSLVQPQPRPAAKKFVLYFTDTENNRVRKIDAKGIVSTVVGNGSSTSSGDNGPATKAGLNRPEDVVRDDEGNLYISEAHRVRKVNSKGIITTYAGTGKRGFSGAGGPATRANLDSPYGLAIDGHDLYIADSWNNVVWKVDEKGIITVFAGTGQKSSTGDGEPANKASFNAPIYLAIQRQGDQVNLLVSELEGGRVRAIRIR